MLDGQTFSSVSSWMENKNYKGFVSNTPLFCLQLYLSLWGIQSV